MDDLQHLGGYRVLRRLAVGARSTVLLAHAGEAPDAVVLKVAPADDPAALREAAALDRGAGEHVVPMLDACADDDRMALVLPRLPGPDLGRLLSDRTELEGGEAVTILAPLAATIARLHASGVAHGALGPGSVLFDGEGAPVLIGFGAAATFEAGLPEVELEKVKEVAADRAALRSLALAVLARVSGGRRAAARRLSERIGAAAAAPTPAELFELAAALPVRFADASPASGGPAGRLVPVSAPVEPESPPRRAGVWARLEALLERSPTAALTTAVRARWTALPVTRRKFVLAGGAAALALVVALVAVPGGAPPDAARAARPEPSASRARAIPAASAGSHGGTGTGDAAARGDDPVAATAALLRTREDCRRELSVLCLDSVDQDGSSAARSDRAAIMAAHGGGELPDDVLPPAAAAAPRMIERLGGSALVALSGGASVLLVHGSGGWRIRDILPSRSPASRGSPGAAQTPTPSPGG